MCNNTQGTVGRKNFERHADDEEKGERDHQEKRLTDEKSERKVLKVTQRKKGGTEGDHYAFRRTKEMFPLPK